MLYREILREVSGSVAKGVQMTVHKLYVRWRGEWRKRQAALERAESHQRSQGLSMNRQESGGTNVVKEYEEVSNVRRDRNEADARVRKAPHEKTRTL